MKLLRSYAAALFVLLLATGCASTDVTQRQEYDGAPLPHPGRILIYDFTADPTQVPLHSAFAASGAVAQMAPTAQELQVTQELGAEVARQVTAQLQEAGLPAVQAAGQPAPQVNDIVIRGYFVSVDEGSAMKRLVVGFGSGKAKLTTAVEGFQQTPQGLRALGNGTVDSGGNRTGGVIVPAAMMAVTGSPIGLAVSGTLKLADEASGNATIEGNARRTAEVVADQLIAAAERQGWL